MNEIIKDIEGFEGLYSVSSFGIIRYYPKEKGLGIKLNGGVLRGSIVNAGYHRVHLIKDGISYSFYAHRLIAKHFIPNPENKKEVNHKDGNKLNNCVENLEWVTRKENERHAIETGLKKMTGKYNVNSKPFLRINGDDVKRYESLGEANKDGFHSAMIRKCCRGISDIYRGFKWKYA